MYRIHLLLIALGFLFTARCNSVNDSLEPSAGVRASSTPSVTSARGAWLGRGTFTATEGTQQITAQLELLADDTYRFMVIDPRVLMMVVGLEKGTYKLMDQQLDLMPFNDQTSTDSSVLGRAPKNFRPKSLAIDGDALLLKDGQMDLRFEPNLKATGKLAESGDI